MGAAVLSAASGQTNQTQHALEDANAAYLREHYTKYEYRIPMRDGIKLFTTVFAPKDDSQPYPILLTRTPYSLKPYSEDLYPDPRGSLLHYAKEKFIFATQDVRGRYGSDGQFMHVRPCRTGKSGEPQIDETTDAYDTIEWLIKNVPNHNGKVGMAGIS